MNKASPGFDLTNKGLNKTCATKVVDIISDNHDGFGSNEKRGTLMIFANKDKIIQVGCTEPSCNHQLGYILLYASARPSVLANSTALRGPSCLQTESECKANADTTKLNPHSGDDVGCYCIETGPCNTFT